MAILHGHVVLNKNLARSERNQFYFSECAGKNLLCNDESSAAMGEGKCKHVSQQWKNTTKGQDLEGDGKVRVKRLFATGLNKQFAAQWIKERLSIFIPVPIYLPASQKCSSSLL